MLRTTQVRPAIIRHPQSGEPVWFNHAAFFHVSTLPPETARELLEQFGEEELPNNTYYGDGGAIEPSVLDHLRDLYLEAKVMFPWRRGDLLMLDNILTAHARESYAGPRRIVVALADPFTRSDV
jgi:alpha-ketoglutarate-dependent taurine dioxygenase